MKMYKFRGFGEKDTQHFNELLIKIGERINNDTEIIEKAKEANKKYFQKLQEITSKPENAEFAGNQVKRLNDSIGRYMYIKNIEDMEENKVYDAEIDLLTWSFTLLEI